MKRTRSTVRAACTTTLAIALLTIGVAPLRADPIQAAYLQSVRAHLALGHAAAIDDFLAHRYAIAYGRFALLADAGHVPSASVALMMVRHGPSLSGAAWPATPEQLQRWSAMVTADLREHGAPRNEHDGE